jgi:hypothetical protein
MDEIICLIPLIPLRKEPNHRSEMVSQMLFGEKAKIINYCNEWIEIQTLYDSYKGWIEFKSVAPFDPELNKSEWTITSNPISIIKKASYSFLIASGSEIPLPDESNRFELNSETYVIDGSYKRNIRTPHNTLVEIAIEFINAPYLWGGRSIFGIDCSGFTQILYKNIGIVLPRDAKDQARKGVIIGTIKDALPGDLIFFSNENGMIVHVGMLLYENKIIHSSQYVRIDRINEHGIFNEKESIYTHKLAMIRRLIFERT